MKKFDVINPYDQSVAGSVENMNQEDLNNAITRALAGAEDAFAMPAYKRSEILNRAAEQISLRFDEFARLITRESGKAIKYSEAEVARAVQTFRFAAAAAKQIKGETIPMDASPGSENRMAFYQPFPVGVVAGITPFNFPLNLVAHKVAPAIAAGNSMLLKPSPVTPLTSILLLDVLRDAGLPEGVLNLVTGTSAKLGMGMVASDSVDMVSFTGSLKVGKDIKARSGIKKLLLELGSNSACIVEPDSDLGIVASKCVMAGFAYGGQVCISLQRIYAHASIYGSFVEKLVSVVEGLKTGDPMDPETEYGPLISEAESKRCIEWIHEAVSDGARALAGGTIQNRIIAPTVMERVKSHMKIVKEEVFGPVLSLTPYESFEEALSLVNNSRYGLQAGVFTNDINKAFLAFKRLKVGGVIINDTPTYRSDNMPYGGVKSSGIGREGVSFAIEEMMEKKVCVLTL